MAPPARRNRFGILRTVLRPLPVLAAFLFLVPSDSHARYASLVMDARTGEVYRARHADDLRYPASLTKVMTLYMVFEKLESGGWTLDTRLKVSKRAAGQPATRLGLKAGSYLPVRTAIRALVVRSANDVATLIAENHSGSESKFARAMTMRAREIGMFRTTFRNASGLPNRHQKSTARDMALLAVLVQRHFPQYYHFFKTKTLKYKGRTFKNHNALLKKYSGTDGIKTGYIRASGFNLMSSVRRNGQHLVAVVFGGKTAGRRNRHMVKILDSGFKAASRASAQRVPPLPVTRMRVAPPPPVLVARAQTAPVPRPAPSRADGIVLPQLRPGTGTLQTAAPAGLQGRWSVQIGAYSSAPAAHAVIGVARLVFGERADRHHFRVDRVQGTEGQVFRAQVIGFREGEARSICTILRNRGLPCAPVRAGVVSVAAIPTD